MKKLRRSAAFLLSGMLAVSSFAFSVSAEGSTAKEAVTLNGITYSLQGNEAVLTKCSTDVSGDIVLPARINSVPLRTIQEQAFSEVPGLTSVTIPEGVEIVERRAFFYCTALRSLSFPSTAGVQEYPSLGCNALETVTVAGNSSLLAVRDGVLFSKSGTTLYLYPPARRGTSYTVPDGVTSLGSYAFRCCGSLDTVTLPDSLVSIGSWCFYQTGLTQAELPDGLTYLSSGAFSDCRDLSSVTIPATLTGISNNTFSKCPKLTDVTIPASVEEIGYAAFNECTKLKNVRILNPACTFTESFSGNLTLADTFRRTAADGSVSFPTLHGLDLSTVQDYAEEFNAPFASLGESEILRGDLNDDGAVAADDAQTALIGFVNVLAGKPSGLTFRKTAAADINYDGQADARDAQRILQYFVHTLAGKPVTWHDVLSK